MSAGDNSRFSYGKPDWDLDRGAIAAASTEVGGQVASKQDLESLLPDSGACVMPGSGKIVGSRFLPFNQEIGTSKGCEVSSEDGIILNKVGRWQVSAATWTLADKAVFSGAIGEIRLELFDPEGNFIKRRSGRLKIDGVVLSSAYENISLTMNCDVDRPGYRVRVYQFQGGTDRISSDQGSEFSELSAQYVYNGQVNFGGA